MDRKEEDAKERTERKEYEPRHITEKRNNIWGHQFRFIRTVCHQKEKKKKRKTLKHRHYFLLFRKSIAITN